MPAGFGKTASHDRSDALLGFLPEHLRVLFVAGRNRTGGWLADAFATDSAVDVEFEEARGRASGLARLREETFDAVLLSHEPPQLDALELAEACRASGADAAIVILGRESQQEMEALCYEAGADAYLCVTTATVRGLVWVVSRAVLLHSLRREVRRLGQLETQRLQREREEAQRLLREQERIILEAKGTSVGSGDGERLVKRAFSLPHELVTHYRELLRTYIIMGAGSLAPELKELAEALAAAGLAAHDAVALHVLVLEDLIRGLGNRSTRHVLGRANVLIVELLVYLSNCYKRRYLEHKQPPRQLLLPGFENGDLL